MDSHAIVPSMLFVCVAAAISIFAYMQLLGRRAMQETLRAAIASGQKLDDETIKAMSQKVPPTPEADLQSGIKDIALGIGFALAALAVSQMLDKDFAAILLVIGIILGASGAGAVFSWKIRSSQIKAG